MKDSSFTCLLKALAVFLLLLSFAGCAKVSVAGGNMRPVSPHELDAIEKKINTYVADPSYPDDPFILVTVKEGLKGARERNGGIGACLVRKSDSVVIEQAHNRQHEPYFRSDLHAEMDLLDRYEERIKLTRSRDPHNPTFRNPRNMIGIVLYTSVEPCPMCLARIINSGVQEVYYAAPDEDGGMAGRFNNLPPSWKRMAAGLVIKHARCSPELKELAASLFRPMFAAGMHQH
jgi:tRNA(adenine34) deaminase